MSIDFNMFDIILISPALALFFASLIPITLKVLRGNKELNPAETVAYALIGVLAAAFLTVMYQFNVNEKVFMSALTIDGVSAFSTLVVLVVTGFSLFFAKESKSTLTNQFSEFVFLLLNAAVGMMIVAWSNDLIVTFIGIEIMSLCLYILIALSSEVKLSKEAAFKYFVLGSFGSALFLYGVAFIYGTTQTTYLQEIAAKAPELIGTSRLFVVGLAFSFIGFCFKVGLAPFHAWSPDVYQGSPSPVTGFMATGVKLVVFAAFLRLVATKVLFPEAGFDLIIVLQWVAVGSMLLGNIAAIKQNNFKRMLAYSSISHSGYILVGLIAAAAGGESLLGASGMMFYILAYTVMTLGTFGFACLFELKEDDSLKIDGLKGFAKKSPWLAACLTILLLSLAGIPPTIGFFGKFFLFSAAIKQGFFWLAIWGVINSVISVYYYLRPIVYMYMSEEESSPYLQKAHFTHMGVSLTAILTLAVGFIVEPFYRFVVVSLASLF